MFLKKHSQPEWTPADRQRERLLLDYFAAETNLEEKAKAAIVRKGVIDLYPDGPREGLRGYGSMGSPECQHFQPYHHRKGLPRFLCGTVIRYGHDRDTKHR